MDSRVISAGEGRNTISVSTCSSNLFQSDEKEFAESWRSGRAGESAMQVETGVLDGVRRLPGTIIILAEFIPSWLLLLRDRIDSIPFIYVKDECSWFRQSLGLTTSSCHQGSFDSDEWRSSWSAPGLPCSVFIQGSVAFCRDMLKSQEVLQCQSVVAIPAGRVRLLPSPSLWQVKLRHCEVGGVTNGLSSIIASRSLLGMVKSEGYKHPWQTQPMHRILVDSLKVNAYGTPLRGSGHGVP